MTVILTVLSYWFATAALLMVGVVVTGLFQVGSETDEVKTKVQLKNLLYVFFMSMVASVAAAVVAVLERML